MKTISIIILISLTAILPAFGQGPFGQDPFDASPTLKTSEGGETILEVSFSIPGKHYLYAEQTKIETEESVELIPKRTPEAKKKYDPFFDETVDVYNHDMVLSFTVKQAEDKPITINISYQGCNDQLCFRPTTKTFTVSASSSSAVEQKDILSQVNPSITVRKEYLINQFKVSGKASGYLQPDKFKEFLAKTEAGDAQEKDKLKEIFESKGIWLAVILILFGGLALNLTPCILPMIPINLAIIGAGAGGSGSRARGFILGGAYGLGITLVYGVLGLMAILTGTKFGTLNSSPWFNFGIAIVFMVLSLAMFNIITVDFSKFQSKIGTGKSGPGQGNILSAFFMGGIAALLAGACVAPVVISVLLLSTDLFSRGNTAGLLLPFLLGFGMALPWPFAGAGLSLMPKPGKWMEHIKHGFGVVIIVFAIWYGNLGYNLLWQRIQSSRAAVKQAEAESIEKDGWFSSLEAGLTEAVSENKPIFIDFWASWCKNCLKMEKTTFKDPEVVKQLDSYIRIKFRAENLSDPDIEEILNRYKVIGLPTYVILSPAKADDR